MRDILRLREREWSYLRRKGCCLLICLNIFVAPFQKVLFRSDGDDNTIHSYREAAILSAEIDNFGIVRTLVETAAQPTLVLGKKFMRCFKMKDKIFKRYTSGVWLKNV